MVWPFTFWSSQSRILDATYVPLFERYTQSDVPSVRHTAEFEKALLGQPNVQLWIDALAQPDGPIQMMARRVISSYATEQIKTEGRQLQGTARDQLVTAALKAQPVNPVLLPGPLPQRGNIRQVVAGTRFATVEVVLSMRGYTMVFERRGDRWIYLLSVNAWLA